MALSDADSLHERLVRVVSGEGLTLSQDQIGQLEIYLRTLEHWNRTINLTSLPLDGFPDASLERLIAEPMRGVLHVEWIPTAWYDLGSGGGSPAIPMRIALPGAALTMVESRGRKAAFLRDACSLAGLDGVRVVTCRIEGLPETESRGSADLVTARAVRIDAGVAASIQAIAKPGSRVVLFGNTDWSPLQPFVNPVVQDSQGISVLDVPRGT